MSDEPLSPKHEAFVTEYLKDRNAAAAAQRAGYSPRSAASLMAMESIRAEIQRRQEAAARESGVTLQSLIKQAEEARAVAEQAGNASAMVAAIQLKAKLTGQLGDVSAPAQSQSEPVSIRDTALAILTIFREVPGGAAALKALREAQADADSEPCGLGSPNVCFRG
jgi:hypothetical protein